MDVLRRDERAHGLAEAYRRAIGETAYYREWFVGEEAIPIDVLVGLAERGCLCRLVDFEDERALIRSLFFDVPPGEQPAFVTRDVEQRRRSTALLLRAVDRSADIVASDERFRALIWEEFSEEPSRGGSLGETLAQWAGLAAKDYWQDGLSVMFAELCRRGLASSAADGLSSSELDALILDELPRGQTVVIEDRRMPVERGGGNKRTRRDARARDQRRSPRDAARTRQSRRGRARQPSSSSSRPCDACPSLRRRPKAGGTLALSPPNGSPRFCSSRDFWRHTWARAQRRGETLVWLVRRFVVGAHERIAYSKLPDFTFRFRWEGGRLRFYPIGGDRFGTADIRRASLARLTEDIGLWERAEAGPVLTDTGREFIRAVLG